MYWRERKYFIYAVLVIVVVISLTFSLRGLPMRTFWSSLLFSMTVLIIFSGYDYYQFQRRHHQRLQQIVPQVDLSPQSQAEKDMQKLLEEQKEYYETKIAAIKHFDDDLTDVVRIWSHQMKVPLSVLNLMGQTGDFTRDELKEQTFQLENYLEMLLHYLRLNHEQTDYRFTKVPMKPLVQSIVRKFAPLFIRKGLSVTVDGDTTWTTDEKWLGFALEQIISNSVKYTKQGNVSIQIKAKSIQISDTGIGILKEDLPRLFEHGFTGYNGRRDKKATGLGFFLAKEVANRLSLSIHVDSEIDKGTTVTLKRNDGA
ncbi:sensor histidine kinase [Sporolactobacillus terrae]|uniref:histidine kinase n=1 Tax=Sporolactobacillus terrae TaxID=269673 RepID=A0A410DAU1_9BACL|nr:sensor histidine kinase [Sporolactobacillus terrae]QAA23189.1 sensor histidine kinase [Sporolactobacillus terrae]QAA26159.1 sensor histidine kinase [Sporolactobacillus terrae]UAK15255.1 sensor histidine kinase [Sporolactobacillus terrae]BBN99596.1 histidine kinase [Sporolactobacillus terrae]